MTRLGRGVVGGTLAVMVLAAAAPARAAVLVPVAFGIAGLAPGPHIVRVEPLDDADSSSFFDAADIPHVDVGIRVAYAPVFAVVPRGGRSTSLEIVVTAR